MRVVSQNGLGSASGAALDPATVEIAAATTANEKRRERMPEPAGATPPEPETWTRYVPRSHRDANRVRATLRRAGSHTPSHERAMNRRIRNAVSAIDEPRRIDQGEAWNRWRDELAMGLHGDPIELRTSGSTSSGSPAWRESRALRVNRRGAAAPLQAPTDHAVQHRSRPVTRSA